MILWKIVLFFVSVLHVNGLYCQPYNCYEVLQISQSATNEQVKKAFRLMARRYHPDKNQKEDTTQLFHKINEAYEILQNQHTRKAYDYYLSDPTGSAAYHTYQFYKASYSPQTNPFLVLFIFILLLSWLQWVMRKQMYQSAIDNITGSQGFRKKVNEECEIAGKKKDKYYKVEVAERLQKQISIEGGYSEPKVFDLLIFRIALLPYTLVMYFSGWAKWIWNYYIKRKQYDRPDQQYLTIKALKIPTGQWNNLPEHEKTMLLSRKLWIKENLKNYYDEQKQRQLQEIKATNPAKYRKIMAYLKKNS